MKFEYAKGATPIDPDEAADLIPTISTQSELNEIEQWNISGAVLWARDSKKLRKELITVAGLLLLHKKMFDSTWKWAGQFRKSDKNIGVPWTVVSTSVGQLCGDVTFQIDNKVFDWDELAIRFHHRLVLIHPFANGNGRHSRLATDLLLKYKGQQNFSWGGISLIDESATRTEYIASLQEADRGSFERLLKFART